MGLVGKTVDRFASFGWRLVMKSVACVVVALTLTSLIAAVASAQPPRARSDRFGFMESYGISMMLKKR